MREPYLEQLGFVINTELKAIICEGCKFAYPPAKVKEHIQKKHATTKIVVDMAQVKVICDKHHVTDILPTIDLSSPHTEYLGLAMHQGLGCMECEVVCGTVKSMAQHYKTGVNHPKQAPEALREVHYQQLTTGKKQSKFFEVTPRQVPTIVDAVEDMIAELRKAANSAGGDATSNLNSRQINPWMLTTKWYLHVEGADALALKNFVAPHKEIAVMVKSYFAEATQLLSSTEELVRQKINSPDHIKLYVKIIQPDLTWADFIYFQGC